MNGKIETRAGEFYIQEKVWFQLRQTDKGTEICVCDARVDRRYAICLDEDGCIVHGDVQSLSQKVAEAPAKAIVAPPIIARHTEAYDVNRFYRALEKGRNRPLQRFKTLAKYRFTLRWGKNARPSNKCFPLAGYANDSATYILYRIPSSSKGEGLLRLLSPDLAVIDKDDQRRIGLILLVRDAVFVDEPSTSPTMLTRCAPSGGLRRSRTAISSSPLFSKDQ